MHGEIWNTQKKHDAISPECSVVRDLCPSEASSETDFLSCDQIALTIECICSG